MNSWTYNRMKEDDQPIIGQHNKVEECDDDEEEEK